MARLGMYPLPNALMRPTICTTYRSEFDGEMIFPNKLMQSPGCQGMLARRLLLGTNIFCLMRTDSDPLTLIRELASWRLRVSMV
jgi:hypothetical protein